MPEKIIQLNEGIIKDELNISFVAAITSEVLSNFWLFTNSFIIARGVFSMNYYIPSVNFFSAEILV